MLEVNITGIVEKGYTQCTYIYVYSYIKCVYYV